MAVRLRLVSTQTLSLLAKAGLLGILIFLMRSSGRGLGWILLFLIVLAVFYFRPAVNWKIFLSSAFSFIILALALPVGASYIWFLGLGLGVIAFLLLGVKNLVFVERETFYNLLHYFLIAGIALLFINSWFTALGFILLLSLFHEFYGVNAEVSIQRKWLASGVGAIFLTQTLWIISLLPLGVWLVTAMAGLLTFIFHDLTALYFKARLSRELVLRDTTILVFISLLILTGLRVGLI